MNKKIIFKFTTMAIILGIVFTGCGKKQDTNSVYENNTSSITSKIEISKENTNSIVSEIEKTKEEHVHKWKDATCISLKTCTDCGTSEGGYAKHIGGKATCKTKAICKICEKEYGTLKEHSWIEATCNNPKMCSVCKITNGSPLGHIWQEATCNTPKNCARCGFSEWNSLGHNWINATCTDPTKCSRCNEISGAALGHIGGTPTCTEKAKCTRCNNYYGNINEHSWINATCIAPKTCSKCNITEGQPLGHTWQEATCLNPKTCKVCNLIEETPLAHNFTDWVIIQQLSCTTDEIQERYCKQCNYKEKKTTATQVGHTWTEANCVNSKTCSKCNISEGDPLGHSGGKATCTQKAICTKCNSSYGELQEHKWIGADCLSSRNCSVCNYSDGEALGHIGGIATCTTKGICTRCNQEYINELGHEWQEATCDTPKTCRRCSFTEGEKLGHSWIAATCIKNKYCSKCNLEEEGSILPHSYGDWNIISNLSCTTNEIKERVCIDCSYKEVLVTATAIGHIWNEANCLNPKTCSICNTVEGTALGHIGGTATTTQKAICTRCNCEYGDLLPTEEIKYFSVYDLNTGKIVTDTEENILAQIVMNEMSGAFTDEALKAQAVTARSWLMYEYSIGSQFPQVGLKEPNQKCIDIVNYVKGEYVTYNNQIAFTPYFSCSNGKTQSSEETWGGTIPYLVAVDSAYDNSSPAFLRTKNMSKDLFVYNLTNVIDGLTLNNGAENDWVKIVSKTSGNYNDLMEVGGLRTYISKSSGKTITLRGRTLVSILSLRSPDFDISYSNENFAITTRGFGHGCGMSQWGAQYYSVNEGWNYSQIISHYFPGTTITK